LKPFEMTEEKNFKITTDPSFSFEPAFCEDAKCSSKSKVFILSDEVYLNYTTDVQDPSITTSLIYPDGTEKPVTLPTTIDATQTGTYTLESTASKEGYKTMTTTTMFGVIKEDVDISKAEKPRHVDRDEDEARFSDEVPVQTVVNEKPTESVNSVEKEVVVTNDAPVNEAPKEEVLVKQQTSRPAYIKMQKKTDSSNIILAAEIAIVLILLITLGFTHLSKTKNSRVRLKKRK